MCSHSIIFIGRLISWALILWTYSFLSILHLQITMNMISKFRYWIKLIINSMEEKDTLIITMHKFNLKRNILKFISWLSVMILFACESILNKIFSENISFEKTQDYDIFYCLKLSVAFTATSTSVTTSNFWWL